MGYLIPTREGGTSYIQQHQGSHIANLVPSPANAGARIGKNREGPGNALAMEKVLTLAFIFAFPAKVTVCSSLFVSMYVYSTGSRLLTFTPR